jgi:hypothetical protein
MSLNVIAMHENHPEGQSLFLEFQVTAQEVYETVFYAAELASHK